MAVGLPPPGPRRLTATLTPAPQPAYAPGSVARPGAGLGSPADRASALYRPVALAIALTEAVTARQVSAVVTDELLPAFGGRQLAIYLMTEGHLYLAWETGFPQGFLDRFEGIGLSARLPGVETLVSGRPLFFESMEHLAAAYPGIPLDTDVGARAFLPLIASGRPVGSCILGFDQPRGFSPEERTVLTALAGLIAQALQRAQRYDTEAALARGLQNALLPHRLPVVENVDTVARYLPGTQGMDVGGDWYDVVDTGRGLALVVGDVQGHGVAAAATMGQLRSAVRAFALAGQNPQEVMCDTNRLLIDIDPDSSPPAATSFWTRRPAPRRPCGPGTRCRCCATRRLDGSPGPGRRHRAGRRQRGDVPRHRTAARAGRRPGSVHRRSGGAAGRRHRPGCRAAARHTGGSRLVPPRRDGGPSDPRGPADRRPARRHCASARRPLGGTDKAGAMSAVNAAGDADFRGPLDVSRAATAVLDTDGTVVGWSPAAQTLLGYPPHEVLGRPVATFVVGGTDGARAAAHLPDTERFQRQVLRMRHRDGRVVRVVTAMLALSPAGTGPARLLTVADAEETEQWEALQAMLRGLATQSPVGLAIYDTDLRVVWTNAALLREMGTVQYAGLGPDEMVADGKVLSERYPPTLEETMRQVLTTGEPVIELQYSGRPPSDPERDHIWSCSYYWLRDAAGVSLGVCEETFDVTDRYLAQQRLDLLVRAGGRVGTTLDMTRTAQELCTVTVPQFADEVTVDLLEAVLKGEQPVPGTASAGHVVRVWGGAGDGTAAPSEDRPAGRRIDYPPDSPQARSLASGRSVQEHPDRTGADATAGPPRARLVVPLRAEGATLGVVTFAWDRRRDPFDAGELAVADELVARTAVSIDNARRYTREHTAALMLQHSLLPRGLPRPWTPSSWRTATCRRTTRPVSAATGSTSSPCRARGWAWSWVMWSVTACARPPPWAGCARAYARSPGWTSRPTSSSPAWTTWSRRRPTRERPSSSKARRCPTTKRWA